MRLRKLHKWTVTPAEAIAIQKRLAERIELISNVPDPELVAGCDVSYNRFSNRICAAVVVYRVVDRSVVEVAEAVVETKFPYVSGLLSFREAPAMLEAFRKLKARPDVVIVDGQGIAHRRRMGIASHIGLWIGLPTIGCGKSRLFGEYDDLSTAEGSSVPLVAGEKVLGRVIRSKVRANPLFVSPGHRIDVTRAAEIILLLTRRRRLPEPIRLAHEAANDLRRSRG